MNRAVHDVIINWLLFLLSIHCSGSAEASPQYSFHMFWLNFFVFVYIFEFEIKIINFNGGMSLVHFKIKCEEQFF